MELTDENVLENTTKRTGKEIKINGAEFGNEKLSFKIGASFEKQKPDTIYIDVSFWVDIKERELEEDKFSFINYDHEISRKLSNSLRRIYRHDLKSLLEKNKLFPYYLENIFVYNFPENINYNMKRSFVSIEMNLHTINCKEDILEEYPLSEKKDTRLFDEAKKICQIISGSDLLQEKLDFSIHKKKKD